MISSKFIRTLCACLGLLASTSLYGGHWVVPRLIVWALMIVDYSRTTSFGRAVELTVTGQRPCERCHAISLAQAAENRIPSVILGQSMTESCILSRDCPMELRQPDVEIHRVESANLDFPMVSISPPTPPPRLA